MGNIYVPKKFPGVLEVEQVMCGIRGEYLVQIMRPDGSKYCPFGENYQKNLILDSLLREIMTGLPDPAIYPNFTQQYLSLSLFLCAANLGNNPTPPTRSDPHRENWDGTQNALAQTYASSQYTFQVIGDEIELFRDFIFDKNTTLNPVTYRDCWISLQRGNVQTTACTSRFVFPADVTILPYDRLIVNYRLRIKMPYIQSQQTSNAPFYLSNGSLNFDGNWGFTSSNTRGLFDKQDSNQNNVYFTYYSHGLIRNTGSDRQRSDVWSFNFTQNTRVTDYHWLWPTSDTHNSVPNFGGGCMQVSPFGINTTYYNFYGNDSVLSRRWLNNYQKKIGFYPTTHTPVQYNSSVDTASLIPNWTPVGPQSLVSTNNSYLSNFQQSDNESSIDHEFIFPAHLIDRTVGGIYFNANDSASYTNSVNAHWLKFNTAQTIPAFLGIIIKLRWKFRRL